MIGIIGKLRRYLDDTRDRQRIAIALGKGAVMKHARSIDLARPESWEFSGFSQNGEDGVIDVLRHQLQTANRYFVEIGSADGVENNSGWLVVAGQCEGIMIDADARLVERARRNVATYSIGTQCHHIFVTRDSVDAILELARYHDPDVFSLDIDGNDFYIAHALLSKKFRPRIAVVEYNSVFGPSESMTVRYRDDFSIREAHPTQLYYGASVAAWKVLFEAYGYRFVCVDRNGVNAFFVDPQHFDGGFLAGIGGQSFAENRYQLRKFGMPGKDQFGLISQMEFVRIDASSINDRASPLGAEKP